ncbi:hypothetical protein GCM10014719_07050 [Planomonospora parontospora subsp. antibiotica]|nr:hypothetical protein GCM10014719_07050 [Planomonospora parontospora subsp. antibiotica]GII14640.1 hypothetical protein Ppa05_13660 [Planomonospora parontospora subsp. antibiotica]
MTDWSTAICDRATEGFDILLRLKAEDSNLVPEEETMLRFAVHRPGTPEASPRSHPMPWGGRAGGLVITTERNFTSTWRSGVRIPPRSEARGFLPRTW